jgi:hypothetical protein
LHPTQIKLIGTDGTHAQLEAQAAIDVLACETLEVLGAESLPHPFDVFQRTQYPAHALEIARAGLEFTRWV